jgi:hypothetical protein
MEFLSLYIKITPRPPLQKGGINFPSLKKRWLGIILLFGKKGLGEIFIILCDSYPSW